MVFKSWSLRTQGEPEDGDIIYHLRKLVLLNIIRVHQKAVILYWKINVNIYLHMQKKSKFPSRYPNTWLSDPHMQNYDKLFKFWLNGSQVRDYGLQVSFLSIRDPSIFNHIGKTFSCEKTLETPTKMLEKSDRLWICYS